MTSENIKDIKDKLIEVCKKCYLFEAYANVVPTLCPENCLTWLDDSNNKCPLNLDPKYKEMVKEVYIHEALNYNDKKILQDSPEDQNIKIQIPEGLSKASIERYMTIRQLQEKMHHAWGNVEALHKEIENTEYEIRDLQKKCPHDAGYNVEELASGCSYNFACNVCRICGKELLRR